MITLAFTLGFFTPALADYLGPNRTVTTASEVCKVVLRECMYVAAKGDYRYHKVDEWSCASEGKEWLSYPSLPSSQGCFYNPITGAGTVGDQYWEKEYSVVTATITHPEATITGALQNCTLQNGWCVTPPQLELTANEPLAGHQILLIEGTRNAEVFACPELQTSCQIPLLEGENNFEYWALSSWGDSSRKGAMNVKVDTVAPNLNLLVNGVLGSNNWYVSNTIITAEGADETSGVYEKVLSIDGGSTWLPSTTLTDGVYQVDIKITDNAYNVSTASTALQVDTVTPTLSLSVSGTKGNNNYYVSKPKITVTAFDATSGVAKIEMTSDGGPWTVITAPVEFSDGVHTYQFRAYDNAGNMTETPVQTIQVDTIPPTVEADEEINLGEPLYYVLRDNGSGLFISKIVIEDEDEKYKKIVWAETVTGNKIEGDILWDGKFPSNTLGTSADKTVAGVGEYFITFKISDRAGNETFHTSIVNVNPLSYFQTIPEFIPPESVETSDESASNEEAGEQHFGGTMAQTENPSTTHKLEFGSSATAGANATTNTTSNILWGTAAAAVIGMATAYALEQQKKREEEEAAQIAQVTAEVEAKNAAIESGRIALMEQLKIRNWQAGKDMLDAWIEVLEAQGASPEQIAALKEQGATQGLGVAIANAQGVSQAVAAQNAKEKYTNLTAAEAEMGRVVPVTAYAPLGYVDEEEEQWLEEGEGQRAWEAVQGQSANPFAGMSAGGGSKPLAALANNNNPPSWLDRLWFWSEWNNTRRDLIHNLEEHQQILIEASGNQAEDYYYYDAKTLGLHWWQFPTMSAGQFQKLNTYIDSGQVSWNETLSQVNTLQTYFGYNNKTMVTALRELYYGTTLDYFIANAKPVNSTIYQISGNQNGITSGEASFSRALLLLTTQGHGYTPAVVQIQHPHGYNASGEFAFDHIIAAIDGNFNNSEDGANLGLLGPIAKWLLGLDASEVQTLPAVTYLGDLAGSTAMGFKYSDASMGYEIEMPYSDLEGDILGVVLANNNAINPNGNNLSEELSNALSANSPYVVQKYSYFADAIGLEINNGNISPISTQTFMNQNKELIADLGSGFYMKNTLDFSVALSSSDQSTMSVYAEEQINQFFSQIEQGLQAELQK